MTKRRDLVFRITVSQEAEEDPSDLEEAVVVALVENDLIHGPEQVRLIDIAEYEEIADDALKYEDEEDEWQ